MTMSIWQALDMMAQPRNAGRVLTANVNLGNREVQIIRDSRGLYSAVDTANQDQLVPPTTEGALVNLLRKLR